MSLKRQGSWGALLALATIVAPAGWSSAVTLVHIDTAAIASNTGWLDIQFNPGSVSWQAAMADVSAFSMNGTLLTSGSPVSPDVTTGVTGGPLPSTLIFHNADSFNDYFQRVTFGSFLDFTVTLYGDAVDAPDPNVYAGTSFSFALYGDDQSTPLLGAPPLFQLDINVGGSITPTNNAPDVVTLRSPGSATVPEPSSLALCAGMAVVLAFRRKRRNSNN